MAKLTKTNISQPAIYTCSIASWQGLREQGLSGDLVATAGLSLGEYTALHLAGVFTFEEGLELVATRGRLMQEAAEAEASTMVAVIGDDEIALQLCEEAKEGDEILVAANFNAPGQTVLSGSISACNRVAEMAEEKGRARNCAVGCWSVSLSIYGSCCRWYARSFGKSNLKCA